MHACAIARFVLLCYVCSSTYIQTHIPYHTYIHTYIHTCMHAYIHAHVYTHFYLCIQVSRWTQTRLAGRYGMHLYTSPPAGDASAHACQCIKVLCVCVCMYVCMYACMYIRMPARRHVIVYVCMYVCMHACMHAWMNEWGRALNMNIQIQGIDVFMHHYMFSLPRPLSRPLALSLYFPPSLQHSPSSHSL